MRLVWILAVAAFGLMHFPAAAQNNGPLRPHPENRRYFTDNGGKAILLAGSHTWSNIIDIGPADPPPPFDFEAYLAWLKGYGHNFTRGWFWEPTRWDTTTLNPAWRHKAHTMAPQPWARTGPELALDGKPKFDLEQFNPEFFDRLESRVAQAQAAGIFISIMLFDGHSLQFFPEAWPNHPFNPSNNINGIGQPPADKSTPHQLLDPRMTRLQETYARKVIETLNHFDNVLYEITNEAHPSSTEWQYHMLRFIRECEKALPKQHPLGMTFQYAGGKNETLFESPADWISPNGESGFDADPPDMQGRKIILSDTDHLWGIGGNMDWLWKSVTRGINPIFMDPYLGEVLVGKPTPQYDPIRKGLGRAVEYSRRFDLARALPASHLASTGYCLAEPGANYLVYAPQGGEIELDLEGHKGSYNVEWLNPDRDTITSAPTVQAEAKMQVKAPFDGPAVFYVNAQSTR